MRSLESSKRIKEEFRDVYINSLCDASASVGLPEEDNFYKWRVALLAPKDTPYKGGLFYIEVIFPQYILKDHH